MTDFERFWASQKELASEPAWKQRDRFESVRLVSAIDIDGITQEGFYFSANAQVYLPDSSVTFQIEYHPIRNRQLAGPIFRFDWRPRAPHNNKGVGPVEYRFHQIVGSHLHDFELNWDPEKQAMKKGNLPIAVPVSDALDSYQSALDFVEKKFRIKGVGNLPAPPWTKKLI